MWHMELACIPVQGWIIGPYKMCFFYCSFEVLILPSHYTEVSYVGVVTRGVGVVKYQRGCLLMFLEPLTKHPWGFSNVFLITVHPITPVSVDDPTFLHNWIFVLGDHQEVLDGIASFKIDLHSMSAAYFLQALTQTSMIRYHHVWFLLVWGCLDQFLWCYFFFWLSFFVWS